jgi:hypothetical protein
MNRLTNSFLLVLFIPLMGLSIFVSFDLPLGIFRTTGAQLPYRAEIFLGLAFLVTLLLANRSIKRWMGLYTVSQTTRFAFHATLAKGRILRVKVYSILESSVYACCGLGLWALTSQAWPAILVMLFFSLDGFIFVLFGAKRFAIGLSSKAILVADREVTVIYYTGLRKVSISQQTLYFDYLESLQLSMPINVLPEQERANFVQNLEKVVDADKVLIQNLGPWRK